MIPASHLLSGYLAGRMCAWRRAARSTWREPVVLASIAGSVLPDLDVLPGLLFGFEATAFHRGPAHSIASAVIEAAVLGGVASWLFRRTHSWRPLFLAALAGIATHLFWDLLNPWGETILWPLAHRGISIPLVHEGDLVVLAILVLAALLAGSGRIRAAAALAGILIPVYLGYQTVSRAGIRSLAAREFAGRPVRVYPNPSFSCPWLALSSSGGSLIAACGSGPLARDLTVVRRVPVLDSFWVQATERLPEVRRFRRRDFPFAEVHARPGGPAVVVWKDLRESIATPAAGLYIVVGSSGRVLAIRNRWPLPLWFW